MKFLILILFTFASFGLGSSDNLAPIDDLSLVESDLVVPNSFIVVLKDGVSGIQTEPKISLRSLLTSVASHFSSFLNQFDEDNEQVEVKHKYELDEFQGYAVIVGTLDLLTRLRSNRDIKYVEHDKKCHTAAIQRNAPWNLARISQRNLPNHGNFLYDDAAGQNVDIYILDTGVRTTHVEFGGRAMFGASFNGQSGTADDNGHGTHVAGIAAGKTYGVAKKANIISVRVLNSSGSGTWANLIAGLNWSYNNYQKRKRSAVINISISGVKSTALNSAISVIIGNGMNIIVAAGNDATDACNESPASESSAITVGSINTADQMSGFSNYGPCVDIFAPGDPVQSSYSGSDTETAWMAGTSMSSPHVAGLNAVILSAKKLSIYNVDKLLFSSSTKDVLLNLAKDTTNQLLYTDGTCCSLKDDQEQNSEDETKENNPLIYQQL